MSLFLSTSNLQQQQHPDCRPVDVSETIERDCLSVLHKLHDQVNGLQLVQVVVQPLAKLFNPASLAALVTNIPANNNSSSSSSSYANQASQSSHLSAGILATTAIFHHHNISGGSHNHDLEGGLSTSTVTMASATATSTNSQSTHSRSQSFASNHNNESKSNNPLLHPTSTYMMSPDTAQALIARLDTDRDVNWLMEIIGYGLSMPFSLTGEQDSVKDCCTIYCEWLTSSLLPYNEYNEDKKYQQLSRLVPDPIRNEPNRYARKMFSHLYNVFLPRQNPSIITSSPGGAGSVNSHKDQSEANLTAVSRQAVLCHRVLRTIESIAQNPMNLMDDETWNHLLALLLTVNDKLLSCPTEPDDIGTQLHDRILGVLFDLMLLASAKALMTPKLWKTFHLMCLNWRHRPALIDHWKRITLVLTRRVVSVPSLSSIKSQTSGNRSNLENTSSSANMNPIELAVSRMNSESLSQTWYRFLNLIGNPVELSDPNVISKTEEFYHSACVSDNVLDPRQHPCLNVLPQVFLNSVVSLREFVESFLGQYHWLCDEGSQISNDQTPVHNRSSRGSVISLTNTLSGISSGYQPSSPSSHPQAQQPQNQQQALTPTQIRRAGIKSIKGSKVIPFGNSASNVINDSSSPSVDASKLASNSSSKSHGQQFMQPRPSLTSLTSRTSNSAQLHQQQNIQPQFKLFPDRPKCNSILHIFGDWLFSAALIGSDLNQENIENNETSLSDGPASFGSSSTATEFSGNPGLSPGKSRKFSVSAMTGSSKSTLSSRLPNFSSSSKMESASEKITLDQPLSVDSFESGQAEAMAILCRIFSAKSSNEDIAPHYLSRFYLCLQHCLWFGSGQDSSQSATCPIKRQLLASVLINSTNLLQRDLDGINLLIPAFIKAIEYIFECSERDIPVQAPPRQHSRTGSTRQNLAYSLSSATNYDLRRACILTLLNLSAYPFHFKDLAIRNCLNETSPTVTFKSLRSRLLKLLFIALQTETDPTNMQILFGGLSLTIHDLAATPNKTQSTGSSNNDSMRSKKKSGSNSDTQESAKSSLDVSSHHTQDDTINQSSFVFDSKGGFLIKSLHVTCHLLINIWKHDTQVSLAALELLTTIARISTLPSLNDDEALVKVNATQKIRNNNNNDTCVEMRNEYKQTTKWICDYICNQCSRPPPAHSRDMHSTIVSAYQCLSIWFFNHPYLLNDQDCVNTLMEVIELGVSGQKSKSTNQPGSTAIFKGDKVMKPSSMRVRDAAESLLNVCMVRSRINANDFEQTMSSFDTVLEESSLAEMFTGSQYRSNLRQIQDHDSRQLEAYKMFRYYTDDDSTIIALLGGASHDPNSKDSVICLLRTPFGRHCWKMRFNYYTERSREKIIANKTQGLIKRPFSQCSTPSTEIKLFPYPSGQNKSLYFNNSARFFPSTLDNIPHNELDNLVTTLDDYFTNQDLNPKLKSDLERIGKIFNHQVLAEQKVTNECSIKTRRVECEEPQPAGELEAARIIVSHLGLQSSLNILSSADRISASFVNDLKSLDQQPVRICDVVNIFYVRKNRTSAREILESVRERRNVSLSFFEWILELGEPLLVKHHSRWTGKRSTSWLQKPIDLPAGSQLPRSQMLSSDHGGAIFDGDRMTLYWSDMCQELAFLVPHRIDNTKKSNQTTTTTTYGGSSKVSTPSDVEHHPVCQPNQEGADVGLFRDSPSHQHAGDSQNSDVQSLCSVTSDTSSQSARTTSQHSSPRENLSNQSARDTRDNVSLSRQSTTTHRRKHHNSPLIGCDTNIIVCWLECPDDIQHVPNETLLLVSELGYLCEETVQTTDSGTHTRTNKDFVRYFISPMKNGLYRINLATSFGKHWFALPLVDGMTVSQSVMGSLIRESVLNLCRRRRLDADSYQPPHVRRRLKIQDICNGHRISSKYDSTEFYQNLFKCKSN